MIIKSSGQGCQQQMQWMKFASLQLVLHHPELHEELCNLLTPI
jgi:hypothetical protein